MTAKETAHEILRLRGHGYYVWGDFADTAVKLAKMVLRMKKKSRGKKMKKDQRHRKRRTR